MQSTRRCSRLPLRCVLRACLARARYVCQLTCASTCPQDRILLNKTDLVSKAELAEVREELQSINAFAELIETVQSKVDLDRILGVSSFSIEKTLEVDPSFLDDESAAAECTDAGCTDPAHSHGHGHGHSHDHGHGHGAACDTPGCVDEAHDHGHGHGAKKPKVEKPKKKRHDLSGASPRVTTHACA